MKKLKYLSLAFCLMLIPYFCVDALEDDIDKTVDKFNIIAENNIEKTNDVNGSSIIAGNNVNVKNTVKGIDMVFGNVINYEGNSDYSLIAGNTISIKGNINNDGFIFGNIITFDENFKSSRDLFVFGNSINLKGEISRDITIYASSISLNNVTISGDVTIYATDVTIDNSTILGTLSYNEDANININNSSISEKKLIESIEVSTIDIVWSNLVDYMGILVIFAFLTLIVPKLFERVEEKTKEMKALNYISLIGFGLFFLIIIPIISIILFSIPITVALAFLILTLYIILICLSTVFTGYFIGLLIWKNFIKKDINILLVGLLGISIIKILSLIPVIGSIVSILNILISLSIIMKLFTKDA